MHNLGGQVEVTSPKSQKSTKLPKWASHIPGVLDNHDLTEGSPACIKYREHTETIVRGRCGGEREHVSVREGPRFGAGSYSLSVWERATALSCRGGGSFSGTQQSQGLRQGDGEEEAHHGRFKGAGVHVPSLHESV